jgi:hypothetical protein
MGVPSCAAGYFAQRVTALWRARVGWVWLRSSAWCAFVLSCNDPYPLAATACDDWCLATQRAGCEEDYPERCVSACERDSILRQYPRCQRPWLDLSECYGSARDTEFVCVEDQSQPEDICREQRAALGGCVAPHLGACLESCFRASDACQRSPRDCEAQCYDQHVGCEQAALQLHRCELEQPVNCDPISSLPLEQVPCVQQVLTLLECAGWSSAEAGARSAD